MILLNIVWFVIPKDKSLIPQSPLTPPPLLQYDPVWFKHDKQNYYAPKVQLNLDSNPWPPDHDSTFHVPEMAVLATWPSV